MPGEPEPRVRIELTTPSLPWKCSTTELSGRVPNSATVRGYHLAGPAPNRRPDAAGPVFDRAKGPPAASARLLHGARREAADDVLLQPEEQHDDGQRGEHRTGRERAPVGVARIRHELREAHRERLLLGVDEHHGCHGELV